MAAALRPATIADRPCMSRPTMLLARRTIVATSSTRRHGKDIDARLRLAEIRRPSADRRGRHGIERPVVMDDGSSRRLSLRLSATLRCRDDFVEDTYYSNAPDLDVDDTRSHRDRGAAAMECTAVTREETGVLPVVVAGFRPVVARN